MSADRWVRVPVEPTLAMLDAFQDRMLQEFGMRTTAGYHARVYAAMLAAAPAAPAAPAADPDKAAWWALVMGAAASIEDAANCLRDPVAWRQAEGAAAHYRAAAQKLYAGAAPAQSREPLVEAEVFKILVQLMPDAVRLPPGFLDFARAIERAHGITKEATK